MTRRSRCMWFQTVDRPPFMATRSAAAACRAPACSCALSRSLSTSSALLALSIASIFCWRLLDPSASRMVWSSCSASRSICSSASRRPSISSTRMRSSSSSRSWSGSGASSSASPGWLVAADEESSGETEPAESERPSWGLSGVSPASMANSRRSTSRVMYVGSGWYGSATVFPVRSARARRKYARARSRLCRRRPITSVMARFSQPAEVDARAFVGTSCHSFIASVTVSVPIWFSATWKATAARSASASWAGPVTRPPPRRCWPAPGQPKGWPGSARSRAGPRSPRPRPGRSSPRTRSA
jgi:hypothetical protein